MQLRASGPIRVHVSFPVVGEQVLLFSDGSALC